MVWEDPVLLEDVLARTTRLGAAFFGRNTEAVARELIGTVMCMDGLAGRIVETEAYLGGSDLASHSAPGPTARNAVMFGPAAFTYVYFIYGMYHCVNFVTEREGVPGAVLIRAVEPLCGRERMRARRETAKRWEELASGPGRLTRAFGITPAHHNQSLADGPIQVRSRLAGVDGHRVLVSPRIGIRKCADWPLRFFEQGNLCVSRSPLNAMGKPADGRFRVPPAPEDRPVRMRR